jgi:hypothetical protein
MDIKALVEKYKSHRQDYISPAYNETQLRNDFLDPSFELLGWDIKNKSVKPTNEREVILEESIKVGVTENAKKPDYTFRLFSERKFFLEAKRPSIAIQNNDAAAKQIRRYGFTAKLKISAVSNFEYLIIYDCSVKVEENDNYNKARINIYHFTEYTEKFEELKGYLGRESVYSGRFDEIWRNIDEQIKLFSVDDLFLAQINDWRKLLSAEIYKHSPIITEELLNDYVQSYLNRILFLRVCEDRNLEGYQTLLNFANHKDFKALIKKFQEADKKYNSGLFDQYLSDKIIENVSSVFWTIIKQLYYPESPYSFSVFSSDILGNIYEIFLSEKLIIKDGLVTLEKKPENIDKDIIATPTFVINDILRQTVTPFCENKSDKQILDITIADIACGSGAFLLETLQLLNDSLIDFYLKNDPAKLTQTTINTYKLPFTLKKAILLKCIYGIDKDYNAVEATKFGLLLKLLEGEDNASINGHGPILPELSNNIHFGNSLINSKDVKKLGKSKRNIINPFDSGATKYDVIIGNPPYMKSEDMKVITPSEYSLYKNIFKTAYKQYDKYFLFIEKALSLLRDNGYLGYIVPSKFTKVGAGKYLRKLLSGSCYVKKIVSFGANQVFESKTTYTCLLILNKSSNKYCEYYEIKNLSTWKVRNVKSDDYEKIPISSLHDDVWILVPSYLKCAYDKINEQIIILEELIGADNIYNGIQTSANDIYVITVKKADAKYVYFDKEGEWKIEKALTRPYFQTSSGDDNLYTYRPFKPNSLVIYPYKRTPKGIEFIYMTELKVKYPFAYRYFIHYKSKLANPKRDIKPEPETANEWYRYGRHQSLDKCDVPAKIIVGVLSVGDKYAIDYYRTLISSGGTAGYCMIVLPDDCLYSIYYIQALLNSKYLEWYSALIGEVFRGGYIARGTKVLKKLPIRKIDFTSKNDKALHDDISETQKSLIQIQSEIDKKQKDKRYLIKLQRQFDELKNNLDINLKKLFNLKADDKKIPLIKELYEAN